MVDELFNQNPNISGVIHFAASKAVGESVLKPLEYYDNNIGSLVNLLQAIERKGTNFPFIFSSSCTVYGQADQLPIDENAPIKKAESPYGNTKQIGEEILKDASLANKFLQVIVILKQLAFVILIQSELTTHVKLGNYLLENHKI